MTKHSKFNIKDLPSLLVQTYKAWDSDEPFRMSAIVAYYAILSLPALLVIIINLVGSIWGVDIVQGQLTSEISTALGKDAANAIESMISETQQGNNSTISTVIGIGTLIFGSTGVFYHLQISLNQIWKIKPQPKNEIWRMLTNRARSFAFILVIGFLLLISFIITAGIAALTTYIKKTFPDIVLYLAYVLDIVVSMGIITVLFALMFRYLPNATIKWKTVWIGSIITAALFVLGKFLLGLYFGQSDIDSTYGAAGTIVLILLWVSYSCLILFFGAEFTYVYAKKYGFTIEPTENAIKLTEDDCS